MGEKIIQYKVNGGCMRPLIKKDEIISVKLFNSTYIIRPGDIVLYNIGSRNLLHRVWWKKVNKYGEYCYIHDDAGTIKPHWIKTKRIIGKMCNKKPFSSGLFGLIYSLLTNIIFFVGRKIKYGIMCKCSRHLNVG